MHVPNMRPAGQVHGLLDKLAAATAYHAMHLTNALAFSQRSNALWRVQQWLLTAHVFVDSLLLYVGVGEVIKGWDRGVAGMRVGDKRKLTVPPQMAYGTDGIRGAIPPNATLNFSVELVDVK